MQGWVYEVSAWCSASLIQVYRVIRVLNKVEVGNFPIVKKIVFNLVFNFVRIYLDFQVFCFFSYSDSFVAGGNIVLLTTWQNFFI